MKKLFLGLLVLGSITSYAKDFCTVLDYTELNGYQSIIVNCSSKDIENYLCMFAASDYSRCTATDARWPLFSKGQVINKMLEIGFKSIGCGSYERE